MARTYRRDARGRFTSGGSGQTGGRGARLMSAGKTRAGGGAKVRAASAPMRAGTIAKGGNGVRGSVARSLAAVKRKPAPASSASQRQAKRVKAAPVARPGAMRGRVKRNPDAMETLKFRQRRRDRMAANARKDASAGGGDRIFGYKWSQIQAAQAGDRSALRRYEP